MQTVEQHILDNFHYHSDGSLSRDDRRNSTGSYDKDGYLIIKVKRKQFKAHRLIWFLFRGEFPDGEIDHINRVRTDNRIENLRVVTRQENVDNTTKKINKNTGVHGVYLDRTNGLKKNKAFHFHGRTYRFYTVEEAVAKRKELNEITS